MIETVVDDFTGSPKLVGAMEALLGGPVKRYTDQTIFKPSVFKAGRSFYHQDCFYWKLRPKVCLNCWIALDEVAPDAMALGFLPARTPVGGSSSTSSTGTRSPSTAATARPTSSTATATSCRKTSSTR